MYGGFDGATAERCRTHPKLAADLQSLSWGSLYATSLLANVAMGYLVQPDVLGARGCFGLMTRHFSALMPVPASYYSGASGRLLRHESEAAVAQASSRARRSTSASRRCGGVGGVQHLSQSAQIQ